MFRASEVYLNPDEWRRCQLAICDARDGEAIERILSECAGWKGAAHLEMLDLHHLVLVVCPGATPKATP